MTSIICPKCGIRNPVGAITCRKCLTNLKNAQKQLGHNKDPKPPAAQGKQVSPQEQRKRKNLIRVANIARWVSRVWGILLIIVLSPILFFWLLTGGGAPAYVYLAGVAIITGMVVAWWREGLGALVSLAGLAGFYIAVWVFDQDVFRYWIWVYIFILPPIVFLLGSSLLRRYVAAKS